MSPEPRPMDVVNELGLASWSVLATGLRRGWASREDVIAFAVTWLTDNPEDTRRAPALLAGGEEYDDDQMLELLGQCTAGAEANNHDLETWRLAHLLLLARSSMPRYDKLDRLDELYAEFEYPPDMRLCSQYRASHYAIEAGFAPASELSVDPVDAMWTLIQQLKCRLGIEIVREP